MLLTLLLLYEQKVIHVLIDSLNILNHENVNEATMFVDLVIRSFMIDEGSFCADISR